MSSTLALERCLSLKTNYPKIVMGHFRVNECPCTKLRISLVYFCSLSLMFFIRFARDKCFALSCGTLHDPLRAPDFLLPTVSTRADLMKLQWQNSAPCFGPSKRLCIHVTKSLNTACRHISCNKRWRSLLSTYTHIALRIEMFFWGESSGLESCEKDMENRVNEE